MDAMDVRLFSYGTLQHHEVQHATFGRLLLGHRDSLPGYVERELEITDPEVIALSGLATHPVVVQGDSADSVDGTVFHITAAELDAADGYEVEEYVRVEVALASGSSAWVYLDGRELKP